MCYYYSYFFYLEIKLSYLNKFNFNSISKLVRLSELTYFGYYCSWPIYYTINVTRVCTSAGTTLLLRLLLLGSAVKLYPLFVYQSPFPIPSIPPSPIDTPPICILLAFC